MVVSSGLTAFCIDHIERKICSIRFFSKKKKHYTFFSPMSFIAEFNLDFAKKNLKNVIHNDILFTVCRHNPLSVKSFYANLLSIYLRHLQTKLSKFYFAHNLCFSILLFSLTFPHLFFYFVEVTNEVILAYHFQLKSFHSFNPRKQNDVMFRYLKSERIEI